VAQLATSAKSSFVFPGADSRDPWWEYGYALLNSACAPGMSSVEVVGEEHLLSAANSTDTQTVETSTPARVLGQMLPSATALAGASCPGQPSPLQRLPHILVDLTWTLNPALPKPSPALSTGTCKWVLSCAFPQLWQERLPQPDREFAGSLWSAPVLFIV